MLWQKANFVKDPVFYREWAEEHCFCQACGSARMLSTHHIVKPGRSDEACNLLRLCYFCHSLAEGRTIRIEGVAMPKLTLGICLFLKRQGDPDEWNPDRLLALWGRACLPDLEPLPGILVAVFEKKLHLK